MTLSELARGVVASEGSSQEGDRAKNSTGGPQALTNNSGCTSAFPSPSRPPLSLAPSLSLGVLTVPTITHEDTANMPSIVLLFPTPFLPF